MSIYKVKEKKHELRCYGTCFLINDNKLLTASHILIEGCEIYIFYCNSWVRCSVIKQDKRLDLALLKPVFDIKDKHFEYQIIISNSEVHSEYFSEESLIQQKSTGKVIRKNTVSSINIDSTIVNYGIYHGASGCPIICNSTNKLVGILTWTKNGKSGGCVLRLILQFVNSISLSNSVRFGLDIFCKYNDISAIVLNSNTDSIKSGKEIKKINGNPIGNKFVSIESMVYFSETDICHVTYNDGTSQVVELKPYTNCQYCFDKPLSNVTFLDDIIC